MLEADDDVELSPAQRIMRLFEGYAEAYGTYNSAVPNDEKGGKLEIRATAQTLRKPVTLELWEKHLAGVSPLGIIPIRGDNTCLWGVIDVDSYDVDHAALVEACAKEKLPLVVCRSKSGGAHLFLFMAEPVPAELMQRKLREMAALLGYGTAEIFPKQRSVDIPKGDLGSWLNMPYFGGDDTDRFMTRKGGTPASLLTFLREAEGLLQPPIFLREQEFRKKPEKDPDFGDGPPCMQHLAATGLPEGTRNKGLFAFAIFAKKKYGNQWESVLERWNRDYFDPPLPSGEVQDIIRQVGKKDYNYTCREHPISSHCNSSLCRSRKYGVGGDDEFPVISGLSFLNTSPPIWFLDVDEVRLELTTDELQNYRAFHKVCMERLFRCFRMIKQEAWFNIVANAMREAVKIEVSDEVGESGQFYEILEDFLMNKHRGENRDDLLVGRPWSDPETEKHYFRLRDLQKFLEAAGFKIYNRPQIVSRLRSLHGDKHFFNIKGKGCNVWYIPFGMQPTPTPDTPPVEREPI